MSLFVGKGKAAQTEKLLEVLERGRNDLEFFWREFLGRTPHPGQLLFHENAEATLNLLATSNRWGKTTELPALHYHGQIYKVGGETRYLDENGRVNQKRFLQLKYRTIHTAGEWELAALTWDEALKLHNESPYLQALVKDTPRTKPPNINFVFGGRWKFRTLGDNASGIDGDSYYLITIDEAGWLRNLIEMLQNVISVRVADVQGRIVCCGTFKESFSRDFRQLCVRAAANTGANIGFDHRDLAEDDLVVGGLDAAVRRYCEEFDVPVDEFVDAVTRGAGL